MRATPPSQDPLPGATQEAPPQACRGECRPAAECSQPAVTGCCGLLSGARSLGGGRGLGVTGGTPGDVHAERRPQGGCAVFLGSLPSPSTRFENACLMAEGAGAEVKCFL